MAICPKCNKITDIRVVVPVEVQLSSSMDYRSLGHGEEKYSIFIHKSDTAECLTCGYKDFVNRFYI